MSGEARGGQCCRRRAAESARCLRDDSPPPHCLPASAPTPFRREAHATGAKAELPSLASLRAYATPSSRASVYVCALEKFTFTSPVSLSNGCCCLPYRVSSVYTYRYKGARSALSYFETLKVVQGESLPKLVIIGSDVSFCLINVKENHTGSLFTFAC